MILISYIQYKEEINSVKESRGQPKSGALI